MASMFDDDDDFLPAMDIENEGTTYPDASPSAAATSRSSSSIQVIDVEQDITDEVRAPRSITGQKAEAMLSAVRMSVSIGKPYEELKEKFRKMSYSDKDLSGFQTYFKNIALKSKDRVSFENANMVKKISKYPETHEVKHFYYDCQNAPIIMLIHQRKNVMLPEIAKLRETLAIRELQLQMLNVFITVQHPESTAINFIQKCILVIN